MKKIVERLVSCKKVDNSFDIKFWQKAGSQARFSALWVMINEFYKIKRKKWK